MPDYRVEVYARAAATEAGGIDPWTAELETATDVLDWPSCLTLVRVMARAYPNHIVAACAVEAELGTDGLTDTERMDVMRNVEEARRQLELRCPVCRAPSHCDAPQLRLLQCKCTGCGWYHSLDVTEAVRG